MCSESVQYEVLSCLQTKLKTFGDLFHISNELIVDGKV